MPHYPLFFPRENLGSNFRLLPSFSPNPVVCPTYLRLTLTAKSKEYHAIYLRTDRTHAERLGRPLASAKADATATAAAAAAAAASAAAVAAANVAAAADAAAAVALFVVLVFGR